MSMKFLLMLIYGLRKIGNMMNISIHISVTN